MPAHRQRKTPNVRTFHVIAPHWLHHRIIISLNTMRVDLVDETFRMTRPPRANSPHSSTRRRASATSLIMSALLGACATREFTKLSRVTSPRSTTARDDTERHRRPHSKIVDRVVHALNCAANARRRRACERATRSSEPAWVDVFFSASVEGRRPTRARSRVDGRRRPRRRAGRPPSSGSDVFG